MTPAELATAIGLVISNHIGIISLFFALIMIGIWKESISSIIDGIQFRFSKAFPDEDCTIIMSLNGEEVKARIVRIGIITSSFYIYKNNSKLTIPNGKLKDLFIQKILPKE
jgi:hypothetical protein